MGPPPPGATRGLGVTAILLLQFVYACQLRMSRSFLGLCLEQYSQRFTSSAADVDGVAWRPARRIVGRSDFRGSLKFSSGCKSPERQKGDIVLLLPLLSRERVELRKE